MCLFILLVNAFVGKKKIEKRFQRPRKKKFGTRQNKYIFYHVIPKLRGRGDVRTAGRLIVLVAYMRRLYESCVGTDNDDDDDDDEET